LDRGQKESRVLRILLLSAVALLIVAAIAVKWAPTHAATTPGPYAIGLWGDLPYSDQQANVGVPNLIADMNSQKLIFTVHDGDLKAGSTECTDAVYLRAIGYFNSLKGAAMFTPGDNDWTDCDRTAGYNSLAQLDKERKLFFSTQFSLGQKPMKQEVQSSPLCLGVSGPVPCAENRRWTFRGVTYATLNVQGSCNNLCDTNPDPNEYAARNAADIAWLQDTFTEANTLNSAAIMFIAQADPGSGSHRRYSGANPQSNDTGRNRRRARRLSGIAGGTAGPGGGLQKAGGLGAWRFSLLPYRQAITRLTGPTAGELHTRGDVWRQRLQKQSRMG